MRALILAAALVSFPVAAAEWKPPEPHEIALAMAAATLITVDVWQSLDIKNHDGYRELNPLFDRGIGQPPFAPWMIGMNAVMLVGGGIIWYKMAYPWRNVVSIALIGIESVMVTRNAAMYGLSMHF